VAAPSRGGDKGAAVQPDRAVQGAGLDIAGSIAGRQGRAGKGPALVPVAPGRPVLDAPPSSPRATGRRGAAARARRGGGRRRGGRLRRSSSARSAAVVAAAGRGPACFVTRFELGVVLGLLAWRFNSIWAGIGA